MNRQVRPKTGTEHANQAIVASWEALRRPSRRARADWSVEKGVTWISVAHALLLPDEPLQNAGTLFEPMDEIVLGHAPDAAETRILRHCRHQYSGLKVGSILASAIQSLEELMEAGRSPVVYADPEAGLVTPARDGDGAVVFEAIAAALRDEEPPRPKPDRATVWGRRVFAGLGKGVRQIEYRDIPQPGAWPGVPVLESRAPVCLSFEPAELMAAADAIGRAREDDRHAVLVRAMFDADQPRLVDARSGEGVAALEIDGLHSTVGQPASGKSTLLEVVYTALAARGRERVLVFARNKAQAEEMAIRLRQLQALAATMPGAAPRDESRAAVALFSRSGRDEAAATHARSTAAPDAGDRVGARPEDGLSSMRYDCLLDAHRVSPVPDVPRLPAGQSGLLRPCEQKFTGEGAAAEEVDLFGEGPARTGRGRKRSGRVCPFFDRCGYVASERQARRAQFVVVAPWIVHQKAARGVYGTTASVYRYLLEEVDLVVADEADEIQEAIDQGFFRKQDLIAQPHRRVPSFFSELFSRHKEHSEETAHQGFGDPLGRRWSAAFEWAQHNERGLQGLLQADLRAEGWLTREPDALTRTTGWRHLETLLRVSGEKRPERGFDLIRPALDGVRLASGNPFESNRSTAEGMMRDLDPFQRRIHAAWRALANVVRDASVDIGDVVSSLAGALDARARDPGPREAVFRVSNQRQVTVDLEGIAPFLPRRISGRRRRTHFFDCDAQAQARAILFAVFLEFQVEAVSVVLGRLHEVSFVGTGADAGAYRPKLLKEKYRDILPDVIGKGAYQFSFQVSAQGRHGAISSLSVEILNPRPLLLRPDLCRSGAPARAPNLWLLSATSWAGGRPPGTWGAEPDHGSPSHDLQVRHTTILKHAPADQAAIDASQARITPLPDGAGGFIRLSGRSSDQEQTLRAAAEALVPERGRPLFADHHDRAMEIFGDGVRDRRRALMVLNSYEAAASFADHLAARLEAAGNTDWRVHCVVSPEADPDAGRRTPKRARRIQRDAIEAFGHLDEGAILVANLQSVARGHNIVLRGSQKAAISQVYFMHRFYPNFETALPLLALQFRLGYQAIAQPDWFRAGTGDPGHLETSRGRLSALARAARREVERFEEASRGYRDLPRDVRSRLVWDRLPMVRQVLGRATRGGVPATCHFVDAAFLPGDIPRFAEGPEGDPQPLAPLETGASSMLVAMRDAIEEAAADPERRVLAETLYGSLTGLIDGALSDYRGR